MQPIIDASADPMRAARTLRTALRSGFYAVLDRDDEQLARTLLEPGGARVLQVRLKPAAVDDIVRVARMARRVCSEVGAQLVINDRIDVALAVGADGVHLGQSDIPLAAACAFVGTRLAIGVSTHDREQVARAAELAPAYLAYGPVFATTTKTNPDPVQGIDALRAAVAVAGAVPVVAIGGVSPAVAPELYAAGATALCAISAVNVAPDVAAAARAMGRRAPWLRSGGSYTILRWTYAPLHDDDPGPAAE